MTLNNIAACAYLALMLILWLPSQASSEDALPQINQSDLNAEIEANGHKAAFEKAFEAGDEISEHAYTADQGVGANIGESKKFTRFPRADLSGTTEWANHFPAREGGANATSCVACHNAPIANGAGDVAVNAIVDPAHTGDPSKYLERNTLPLFALGPVQRAAEEISLALYMQKMTAYDEACADGVSKIALTTKDISYGFVSAKRTQAEPCLVEYDWSELDGVDEDLVVRAFGWKGNAATIREFTRGAAHNELGMQAVELVGNKDGDFDGVTNEFSVGDMTALTIYMAGLERPVSKIELDDLDLIELASEERRQILVGEDLFNKTGCASCHMQHTTIRNPVFSEPSTTPGFFDIKFPDGSKPAAHNLTQQAAIRFDMTRDQPNNRIPNENGGETLLGALMFDQDGVAVASWFTDFKRHDMGAELADPSDPLGIGAQMWLTRSLAGVGSTGPWMHDGRATTLNEAILSHGGDAEGAQVTYSSMERNQKAALIAFLENLIIYKHPSDEEE